jgi:hypothetical protein
MANNYRHRFDFDIGYLVKSPCQGCINRYYFPDCIDGCLLLDRIHTALANSVSCSHSHSSMESHSIFQDSGEEE